MRTKRDIEEVICTTIEKVTGTLISDYNTNLLGKHIGILPANFLYIFEILRIELELPVYEVLEKASFSVMTIANLAFEFHKQRKKMDAHTT
jgi:hypothetical protein